MSDQKLLSEFIKLKELALWGETGNFAASIKNSYPRYTFFHKDKSKKFISAPMNMANFSLMANFLENVANSEDDLKYSIICKNRDHASKSVIVQAILVVARVGDKIYLGIKKTKGEKAALAEFKPNEWTNVEVNDVPTVTADDTKETVLSYVRQMRFIINKYTNMSDDIPNSKRLDNKIPETNEDNGL